MFVRLVVRSAWPLLSVSAFAFLVACGPKEPPRQAELDIPDPTEPSSSSTDSASAHTSRDDSSGNILAPPPGGKTAVGKGGEPPQVASLVAFTEGLRWGMSHAELTKLYTQTNGVIWKDYDEKLAKARVGPEQTALEAEREQVKAAFSRSFIEFKGTPTGYDTTGIKDEYTYNNKEALMWIQRQGKKRYFFFINDRLWKMYDEVSLSEGGSLGGSYVEAVNAVNAQLHAQGRVQQADPAKGIVATTTLWKDGSSHLRLVDRSRENLVGVVVEESSTLANLPSLRPNKPVDPNEIDPSILAVTRGANRSDPNAETAAPATSASGKKAPPKKK